MGPGKLILHSGKNKDMFKKRKLEDFSLTVFMVASIIVLVFIFFSFSIIKAERLSVARVEDGNNRLPENSAGQRLFLKEDIGPIDPYLTKMPDLYDMIRGPIINDIDPSLGKRDSEFNLVLFSDFECLYCKQQERVIKKLADKYDLRVIWKDYPYSDQQSRSFQAALAARCAQDENAFWQYHDRLYSDDYTLDRDGFLSIAEDIGLDTDEFEQCLSSAKKAPLIKSNMEEAAALGIEGIPFLYVNDQEVMGEISEEELEKMIKLEMGE
jgi:protein-disulfide isomerase